jgi:hypothetical protein
MKRSLYTSLLATMLFVPVMTGGQPLNGPVTGFIFDSRLQAIRPIQGLPGASLLGPAVALPFAVDQAEIEPGGRYALALATGENTGLYLISNLDSTARSERLDVDAFEQITFSAKGTAAVLWSRSRSSLQVISGLPGKPTVQASISLGMYSPAAAAVNDDGSVVLACITGESQGGLYLLKVKDGNEMLPEFLLSLAGASAVTFVQSGRDAVVVDTEAARVFRIRDIAGARETFLLASSADGIDAPVAVCQTDADGGSVLIANSGARTISIADLLLQDIRTIPAPLAPTRCGRLGPGSIFRLNDGPGSPLYILDLEHTGNIYFVPAEQIASVLP